MKYIDLIAYPIMMAAVYVLLGFLNWNRDPETWEQGCRALWICWGLAWGWAFQLRINRGGVA
jgi:hypothetical protein